MLRLHRLYRTLSTFLLALLAVTAMPAMADWQTGVTAFRGGDYSAAARNFQVVVDRQPEWPGGHLMLGRSLLALERKQEALSHLDRAHALQPDDGATALMLGRTHLELGQAEQAAIVLAETDAARLPEANRATFYQLRGQALLQSGKPAEAIADLAQAAEANPDDAKLLRTYGSLELRHGDLDSALTALERAAELEPDDVDTQRIYLSALVRAAGEGAESDRQEAYSRASGVADRLVELEPSAETLFLLGNLQLQGGHADAAFDTFGRAAEADPTAWEPAFYRAQVLLSRKDYLAAESELEKAKSLAPEGSRTRIWQQLGLVYEKLPEPNYFAQAKKAYTEAGDADALARVEANERIYHENSRLDAAERRDRVEQACREEINAVLSRGGIPSSLSDCMARKGVG